MLNRVTKFTEHGASFIALADQGIVSATNFLTGVIIGRACGKAELGTYALVWTIISLITEINSVLTTSPYTVFNPRFGRYQRSRYLGSVLVHQLVLSLMFALVMAGGVALGSGHTWLPADVAHAVLVTASVIVFICLREFVRRVSFAELKPVAAFSVDLITCLSQAGGVLVLLRFGLLTVSRSYELLGISSALAAAGWLLLRWKSIRPGPRLYGRDLERNWQFAKWVLGSCILSLFPRYMFPWVITAFHGTSATGLWAACAGIVGLGNPVALGLGNYVLPNISKVYARSGTSAMVRQVHRSGLHFAALLMPLVLILLVWGERIVIAVYGRAYSTSAGIVILLAINTLITSVMFPYSQGLFSLERAKADTMVNVVTVVLLFTFGTFAVKYYSALGAAVALVLSGFITAAIRLLVFAREAKYDHPITPVALHAKRATV
jgi:O-antigen/teichoic acid export membrane protein